MTILSNGTLHELGPFLLDPFDPESVEPCSYDVHLDLEEEEEWLYPGEFRLYSIIERVSLPLHIRAKVEGKSSFGREGIAIHVTAGFIDPGFKGTITLEFKHLGTERFLLRKGMRVAQLEFAYLDKPATQGYQGKYQGQTGITPAKW